MIVGRQIRAARALLDMSQDDLAVAAGLTPQAIRKIEAGETRPREGTIADITKVFTDRDVEFIGDRGVAKRNEAYRLLDGSDCYLRLLDEVYITLRNKPNAEVLSICTDDSVSPPEIVQAIQRWHSAGIKCRFLTHENASKFDFPINEYRAIPEEYFNNSVMVVYEDKVATLRSLNDAVMIIHDRDQAQMLKGLFEMIWKSAKEIKGKK